MQRNICQYCQNQFTHDKNLKIHQKTAKYCLEIQKEKNNDSKFACDFCDKEFTRKHNLDNHNCKVKKDMEEKNMRSLLENEYIKKILEERDKQLLEKDRIIMEKDRQLEKLQNIISNIAVNAKPITHNTNNTTNIVVNNNRLDLNNIDRIQNVLDENLDGNVLCHGQKGLARMIYDKLLKGEDGKSIYKCVDPSRHNFEYVNQDGNIERDVKANKLTNALIKGDICKKAIDVGTDLWKKDDGSTDDMRYQAFSDKVLEVANIKKDDSKFRSELSALTS